MPFSNLNFRAAAMTLRTVLLSLQALLAAAEPDDPQDAVVANQVRNFKVISRTKCLILLKGSLLTQINLFLIFG